MAVRLNEMLYRVLGDLRYVPTAKRVRANLAGQLVLDTQRAMLIWEPKRVVPSYAVPAADITAELRPAAPAPATIIPTGRPVLTPEDSFTIHTAGGEALDVVSEGGERPGAAFRLADPELEGYVVLDFDAFDWLEEDDPIISHPRDPYHRVDVRHSSRSIRIERDGAVLAESTRPVLVFETNLPVRYYLPVEDVDISSLSPSDTSTTCAYKGEASYWATDGGSGVQDIAWYYRKPLSDAVELAGLVAFFDEHVDVTIDGVRRERPRTQWSKRPTTEES